MTQSCISDFSTLSPVSSTDLVLSLSTDNMSSGDRTDSEDYVLLDHSVFRRTSIPSVPSSVTTLSEAFSNSEGELLSWFPRLTVEDRPNDTPAPTSSGCSTPNKSSIGIFDDIPLSSYAVAASFISRHASSGSHFCLLATHITHQLHSHPPSQARGDHRSPQTAMCSAHRVWCEPTRHTPDNLDIRQ